MRTPTPHSHPSHGTVLAAAVLGLLAALPAAAGPRQAFLWSAKVTCRAQELPVSLPGIQSSEQDGEETEQTDIDVMNVLDVPVSVKIRAVSPSTSAGAASCSSDVRIEEVGPGAALNLTCGDFQELLALAGCPTADAGFLVIESAIELDVIATYTRRVSLAARDTVLAHSGFKNIFGPPGTPGTFPPETVPITVVEPTGPTVSPMTLFAEVTNIPYTASSLGIGLGVGHGLGIGAGVSIDVERVEPRILRR